MSESWAVERGCEPAEAEIRERLRGVPLSERSGTPTKTDLLRLIGLDHLTGARRRRAVVLIQRVWPEVLLARLEEVAVARAERAECLRLYEWAEDERCRARQEADEHQREVARLAEELEDTQRGAALASEQHAAVTEAWGVTLGALDAARAELERLREERDEWRSQARLARVRLTALEPVEQALRVQLQAAHSRADRWGQVAALLGVVLVAASVLAGLASLGVW